MMELETRLSTPGLWGSFFSDGLELPFRTGPLSKWPDLPAVVISSELPAQAILESRRTAHMTILFGCAHQNRMVHECVDAKKRFVLALDEFAVPISLTKPDIWFWKPREEFNVGPAARGRDAVPFLLKLNDDHILDVFTDWLMEHGLDHCLIKLRAARWGR